MSKYIKNTTETNKTWLGKVVEPDEYYLIPENMEIAFANDSSVLTDIAIEEAIIAEDDTGNSDILDIATAINFLKRALPVYTKPMLYPFADKKLPDGKKLFKRVHGVSAQVSGSPDNIDFVVPYNNCKITGVEIINGDFGDKVNFKVYDTPTGTLSGIPDLMLNQFGFNVNIRKEYHKDECNYDADLIKDMKIRVEFDAVTSDLLPKTVYINFILHEVKS